MPAAPKSLMSQKKHINGGFRVLGFRFVYKQSGYIVVLPYLSSPSIFAPFFKSEIPVPCALRETADGSARLKIKSRVNICAVAEDLGKKTKPSLYLTP